MSTFTIKIPLAGGKSDKRRVSTISLEMAAEVVGKLNGSSGAPVVVYKDENYEESFTVLGGLENRFVCEWITIDGGELLLRPGCDQISEEELQVANSDCAWYPVETIVDRETVVDALIKYAKAGTKPSSLNWLPA